MLVRFKQTCNNLRLAYHSNEQVGRIWRRSNGFEIESKEYEDCDGQMYNSWEAAETAFEEAVRDDEREWLEEFYGDANTGGEPIVVEVEIN